MDVDHEKLLSGDVNFKWQRDFTAFTAIMINNRCRTRKASNRLLPVTNQLLTVAAAADNRKESEAKILSMISTFHDNSTYTEKCWRGEKPICEKTQYNYGGIDLKDQKLYPMERKRGLKWYIKMFKESKPAFSDAKATLLTTPLSVPKPSGHRDGAPRKATVPFKTRRMGTLLIPRAARLGGHVQRSVTITVSVTSVINEGQRGSSWSQPRDMKSKD
ncbi:hypothetical protein EVAR_8524_1 [Eumeta japonica]|uniref:PiggyBac transposable element-derived protein domain-containing protein n=1 Tax=Eumeta variegata TaxID=151549 RepID=A0A4C1TXD3_EUMVA|nr:hypothetical protein EVAR_8524_1 [Eumeta japonica]